jgi:hypothetical protein
LSHERRFAPGLLGGFPCFSLCGGMCGIRSRLLGQRSLPCSLAILFSPLGFTLRGTFGAGRRNRLPLTLLLDQRGILGLESVLEFRQRGSPRLDGVIQAILKL